MDIWIVISIGLLLLILISLRQCVTELRNVAYLVNASTAASKEQSADLLKELDKGHLKDIGETLIDIRYKS